MKLDKEHMQDALEPLILIDELGIEILARLFVFRIDTIDQNIGRFQKIGAWVV